MKCLISRYTSLGVFSTLLLAGMVPQFSYAQLEEITVTARRVEESLQDTPVAVTAISGDTLEASGSLDLLDVGDMAPNVDFSNGASVSGLSSAPSVFIRGIGQSDFVIVTDPAVGIYIDGVYLGRSIGGLMDLVDLERVEILRGPQGTLYGRNSIGGAVNYVSKKPSFDGVSGKVGVTVGEYNHHEFNGSVNIPFSDKLAGRFSGMYRKRDGYVDALQYDDYQLGNDDVWALRGQLLFQPTDNLSFELSGDYTQEREAPAPTVALSIGTLGEPTEQPFFAVTTERLFFNVGNDPANQPPLPAGGLASSSTNPACFVNDTDNNIPAPAIADCYGDFYLGGDYGSNSRFADVDGNFFEPENELDTYGWALNAEWETGVGTIKSLTSWREFKSNFHQDGDFSPFLIFENHNRQFDNEQFSQEFQFIGSFFDDKLDITAGLYHFDEQGREIVRIKSEGMVEYIGSMGMGMAAAMFGGSTNIFFDNIRDIDNESQAVYAQAVLHVTERLHLTGGIRYTKDTKGYDLHLDFLGQDDSLDPMSTGTAVFKETTPMISVGYDFSEDVFGYFTWSEGFRDGGFAARFPGGTLPSPLPSFVPEFVTAYEAGVKSEWFDRRFRANVSAFFTEYEDFQTAAAPSGAAAGTVAGTQINIGDVEMLGFETELTALVTDNLTMTWNIGYIDTEIKCINSFGVGNVPTECSPTNLAEATGFLIGIDHEIPRQPQWNWNLGAVYNMPINGMMDGAELNWRANWTFTDEMETGLTNIALTRNPAWSRVDASVTLHPADRKWSLQLGARNLLDENYELQRANQGSTVFAVKARPRQVFGTFRYNFGNE